jgi:diphosphomevalonate decarboxylase
VKARARACANIALAKYWGKSDVARNLTAVPSLSITLEGLVTETTVEFTAELDADLVELDGRAASDQERARVVTMLEELRGKADTALRARVTSRNSFPTAAGLASSASGFAALVVACDAALGLGASRAELSAVARQASASSARSLFGGYVELLARAESANQLASREHFPLELVVAVTARGPKKIGSTRAMAVTKETSPYYAAWLTAAPLAFERVRASVLARDLDALGAAMEHSTWLMHASMATAVPSIRYAEPATVLVLREVEALREQGVPAYFTMDAGPHVKVLTRAEHVERVSAVLRQVPGVVDVLHCRIGGEPEIVEVG